MHSPYTFQELATGTRLDEVYDKTPLQEKLSVVDELVTLLVNLETVTFRDAGRIGRPEPSTPPEWSLSNKTWISGRDIF
jgi:hypothetical protein